MSFHQPTLPSPGYAENFYRVNSRPAGVAGDRSRGGPPEYDDYGPPPDDAPPIPKFNPQVVTFKTVFRFKVPQDESVQETQSLKVNTNDLFQFWLAQKEYKDVAAALLEKDLARALPMQVQIVGATFPPETPYAIKVFDKNLKKMYDPHPTFTTAGGGCEDYGFPLFLSNKTVFRNDSAIDATIQDYANFNKCVLEEGIKQEISGNQVTHVSVPYHNAHFFSWVLDNPENQSWGGDPSIYSAAFRNRHNDDFIRLPKSDYDKCKKFYDQVEDRINAQFYNLSELNVHLVPTSVSEDSDNGGPKRNMFHNITLSLTVYANNIPEQELMKRMSAFQVKSGKPGSRARTYDGLKGGLDRRL